jgi:hypothetical protein
VDLGHYEGVVMAGLAFGTAEAGWSGAEGAMSEDASAGQAGQPETAAQATVEPEPETTSQPEAEKTTQPAAQVRAKLRRRWLAAALMAAGLGVVAVAWRAVYPRPETAIAVPPSPSLVVYLNGYVSQVTYLVTTRDPAGQPELQISLSGAKKLLSSSQLTPLPLPSRGSVSVEVSLPAGLTFRGCRTPCVRYAGEEAWVKPLTFTGRTATVTFPVSAGFGMDVRSVYAYAAIPQVSFMSPASQEGGLVGGAKVLPPTLRAEYRIPLARHYDWSAGPVPTIAGSMATWQELLTGATTPAQTAAGVDHSRQVHDANFTFGAGVLVGFGLSVLLTGFQLLLPSGADS